MATAGAVKAHPSTEPTPPIANAAIRLPALAARLGISYRLAYNLVARGAIRSVRAGKCILISEGSIAAFLAGDDGGRV
jgi:excisionase family DNA binding protein